MDSPTDALSQFFTIGLGPLCLALRRLVNYQFHSNLRSRFSLAHLEDLQNQTIIFRNHSITLRVKASIIPLRE
ncbi:hypothetical protein KDH_69300 [Dictyobacter sp. S3.2.2.5]|uniref:Uncharacterized protein n=1 Tax=Dictyobacter halimunensis TaxID=3026934 RepID=A0ABQ6G5P5_9CHLR|nr:hypothetical protein KDH_69300 [Dictyobacter sp. S3.2.2.5]